MSNILIADSSKSSLVMTSEIFKDKLPGALISIAEKGEECISILPTKEFDMVVLDFDLPDTDGVTLTKHIRKVFSGPILLTAYPEKIVEEAINKELFPYYDSALWVPKPVKFDKLAEKIEIFLINKRRLKKRFQTQIETLMIGKGAGRGKRAPKIKGNIVDISIGGVKVSMQDAIKMKIGEEVVLTFDMPVVGPKVDLHSLGKTKLQTGPTKVRAVITWISKKKNQAGLEFDRLTEGNKRSLEVILRNSEEIQI